MNYSPSVSAFKKIIFFLAVILFFACKNYYKVAKLPPGPVKNDSVIQANLRRYFILRTGTEAFYMSHLEMAPDRKTLTCTLDTIYQEHTLFLHHGRNGQMRYKKNTEDIVVLNEVHLFIPLDSSAKTGMPYTLELDKISKVAVLIKDKSRTTQSYVLGGVGITLGIVAVATIIAAATKSSCPFVSAHDSSGLVLQGEIYGGAIYPQMARNDYLPLNMTPIANGNLQVRISNELKEKQFTDMAELMVVTHKKDIKMRVDEHGRLYSITDPVLPVSARAGSRDVLDLLKKPGDLKHFAFDDTTQQKGNEVVLCFPKPPNAKKAKLLLRLKNSYWLDLIYGKMTEGFGSYYSTFIRQQYSKPAEELNRWGKEQQLPLQISLQKNNEWKPVEDITTFGPLADRETVIPLNLDSLQGNSFTVRLNTGFMFWELDYAAVDFSGPADYTLTVISPKNATDETGRDVTELIRKGDGIYLKQPIPGNATDIEYVYSPNTDSSKTETFILHAKGYYEHVRHYPGAPDIGFLKQFTKPEALSVYSKKLYEDTMNADLRNMALENIPAATSSHSKN